MIVIDIESERNHNLNEKQTHNPWGETFENIINKFLLLIFNIFFKIIFHFFAKRKDTLRKKRPEGVWLRSASGQAWRLSLSTSFGTQKSIKKKIKNPKHKKIK
jgi:hypothetical protein